MIKRLVIIAIVSSSITLICGEYVALAQNVKTERIAISKLKKQLDLQYLGSLIQKYMIKNTI